MMFRCEAWTFGLMDRQRNGEREMDIQITGERQMVTDQWRD